MLSSLELHGVGPADEMAFEFGERLNVFTGDNGVGKSFVLDVIWWTRTGNWPGRPAMPNAGGTAHIRVQGRRPLPSPGQAGMEAQYDYGATRWKASHVHGYGPMGPVVYSTSDGFLVFDPYRNHYPQPFDPDPPSPGVVEVFKFTPDKVWDGLLHGEKPLCNGLIRDWVSWMRSVPLRESWGLDTGSEIVPYNILKDVLRHLSDPDEPLEPGPAFPMFTDDARDIPTIRNPWGGEHIPVVHASAAVRRILMFAYLLTWSWYEHVRFARIRRAEPLKQICLLIDEVEMHLHPRWQRRICSAILDVARILDPEMKVQIFCTTHSPLVLASLETHVDRSRDRLFNFDTRTGKVVIEELEWVKHGDATGWLTSPAFDLEQAGSLEAEQAVRWAEDFLHGRLDQIPEHLRSRDALERELVRVLAASDPFWVSWPRRKDVP
ncbi:MAG: AAA family ATPase [Deltaproteobacteria bacterium]|nr:AAA family ATPase [Deltaproteobacteria bacterium]